MFSIGRCPAAVPQFDQVYEQIEGQFPGCSGKSAVPRGLRGMIDGWYPGCTMAPLEARRTAGLQVGSRSPEHPRRLASFTPATQETNRQLKQFLHHSVYFSAPLIEERNNVAGMVGELFEHLWRIRKPFLKITGSTLPRSRSIARCATTSPG